MTAEPIDRGPKRRRFSVDDYYRMAESGILDSGDRTELIDGEIIEMTPIGSEHAGHVDHLNKLLSERVGEEALVRVQNPVRLDAFSEPEPDVALLEPRDDSYTSSHPSAEDVLLIVEVADTSIEFDRSTKIPMYARHGVPAVWLLDLDGRAVEVHEQPGDDGYESVHSYRGDDVVGHDALGIEFAARDLFAG